MELEVDIYIGKFGGLNIYRDKPFTLGKIVKRIIGNSEDISKRQVYLFFVKEQDFEIDSLKWNNRLDKPMYSVDKVFSGQYDSTNLTAVLDSLELIAWQGKPLIITDSNDNISILTNSLKNLNYKLAIMQ